METINNVFFNKHAKAIAGLLIIATITGGMTSCGSGNFAGSVCGSGGCNKSHKPFNQRSQTVNLRTNRAPHQAFNTNSRR